MNRLESSHVLSTFILLSNLFLYSRSSIFHNVSPWAYFRGFAVPWPTKYMYSVGHFAEFVTCNPVQICSWIFRNIFRTTFYQTNVASRYHILAFIFWEIVACKKPILKNFTNFTENHPWRSLFCRHEDCNFI